VVAGHAAVAADLQTGGVAERREEAVEDPELLGLLEGLTGEPDLPGSFAHRAAY
jgi:hypothetical protein